MTDTNNIYAAGSSNLTIQSAGSVGTLSAPNGSVNIGTNVDGTVTAGTLTSDTLTITEDVNGTNYLSIESGTSYTSFNNNSGNVIAINHSGKVAINSYNFVAPLYVGGSDAGSGRGDAQYFGKGTGTSIQYDGNINPDVVSIHAERSILTGAYFMANSDRRIKQDIEDISDNEGLDLINRIKLKKYNYVDPYKKEKHKTIGFIAQQVDEIIPNAIKTRTDFIPNIFTVLDNPVWEGTKLIYNMSFNENETKKVRFMVEDQSEGIDLEYDNGGFTFNKQYSRVFIWGKEVTDFKSITKDKIFTIGISAIQELSRKHDAVVQENTLLKERLAAIEAKLGM